MFSTFEYRYVLVMKKIMMALVFLFSLSAMSYAQTAAPAKPQQKEQKKKAEKAEKSAKDAPAKATATPAGSHLKKDGTPDKRYKENKKKS